MIRSLSLASALALSLACSSVFAADANTTQGKDVDVTACKKSEDCIVSQGVCGDWVSINKNLEPYYNQFLAMMRVRASCPQQQPSAMPTETVCENHTCRVKGQKIEE
jgi:hypothetical protein